MPDPILTHDWSSMHFATWEKHLPANAASELRILEIGCYEGRATLWFLNRYPKASLTCIDTFLGGLDHHQLGVDFSGVESRFRNNLGAFTGQVNLRVAQSSDALRELWAELRRFDLIVVDGSHIARDVLTDLVLAWPLLKTGGIMILDDYGWGNERPAHETPKPAIDAFLVCLLGQYQMIERGYQVLIRKS